jgi:hypothetical protein
MLENMQRKRDARIIELRRQYPRMGLRKIAKKVNAEFKEFFGDKNSISHHYVSLVLGRNQRG